MISHWSNPKQFPQFQLIKVYGSTNLQLLELIDLPTYLLIKEATAELSSVRSRLSCDLLTGLFPLCSYLSPSQLLQRNVRGPNPGPGVRPPSQSSPSIGRIDGRCFLIVQTIFKVCSAHTDISWFNSQHSWWTKETLWKSHQSWWWRQFPFLSYSWWCIHGMGLGSSDPDQSFCSKGWNVDDSSLRSGCSRMCPFWKACPAVLGRGIALVTKLRRRAFGDHNAVFYWPV